MHKLEGRRFGQLTVISRNGKKGTYIAWLCRCDCGNMVTVLSRDLMSGHTKSCGCARIKNDLKGKRFGRLTVVKRAKNKGRRVMWECICDCGNTVTVRSDNLTDGVTKSCGCLGVGGVVPYDCVYGTKIGNLKPTKRKSTTGVRGVYFHKQSGRYVAHIAIKGSKIHLGLFDTVEEAAIARREAERLYHKPLIEKYEQEKGSTKNEKRV